MKKSFFDLTLRKPDAEIYAKAKARWDSLSKPIDGLGDFETLVCRIAAIQGTTKPTVKRRRLLVLCADNGVVEEGVSQCGKEVTRAVAVSLGQGKSSACRLGAGANVTCLPVDVGIDSDEKIPGVLDAKIARGTKNFLREPAMTEDQAARAIELGIELVRKSTQEDGCDVLLTGEMGIGNTTTSAAMLCALLGVDGYGIVGRGAGLDSEGLERKHNVVKQALAKYDFSAIEDPRERAFEILRTLGGLDIAALVGTYLGAAVYGVPIVVDGLISAVAALCAQRMAPGAKEFAIPSHMGRERGVSLALNELGLKPYLLGNMALGEGTGAILLMPVLDTVLNFYLTAASFNDTNIEQYERFES